MFVLVESFLKNDLTFQPNLGQAILLGIAQQSGIEIQLVQSQLGVLPLLFEDDLDAIFSALPLLDPENYPDLQLKPGTDFQKIQRECQYLINLFYHQQPARSFFNYRQVEVYIQYFEFLTRALEAIIRSGHGDCLPLIDRYVKQILEASPDLIGFSNPYKFDVVSQAIRRRIKSQVDTPIVLGGSLTPFLPPTKYPIILEEQYADYLVVGEGDLAVPRLYEAILDQRPPEKIPNVYYRSGNTVKGTPPEIVRNLDALPFPDFSPFDLDRYFALERILPILASRGCSWQRCAFCSLETYAQGAYRTLSLPRLIEMLKYLKKTYQTGYFNFHDAEIPPERIEKISDAILKTPELRDECHLKIFCRLEKGFLKPGLLDKMHAAGVAVINWGMESGNQRIVNLMRKGININIAGDILQKTHQAGISNSVFTIWGFPGETDAERQDTIDFIDRETNAIELVISSPFSLTEYSPIGQDPENWGLVLAEDESWTLPGSDLNSNAVMRIGEKIYRQIMLGKISGQHTAVFGSHIRVWSVEMMVYIFNSHRWVNPETLASLTADRIDRLYPIITGTLMQNGATTRFIFYDFHQPYYFDAYRHEERELSHLEETLISLSDGTRSVTEIVHALQESFGTLSSYEEIRKQARDFINTVFENHWGLAFEVPFSQS